MADLHTLSAAELLDLYQRKAVSPVDATQAVLDHIARWEPHLHATYALDADAALSQAEASQSRWLKGEPAGPLDGVPTMIKENIATEGVPMPLGTAATELTPAPHDAPPAARLRESGAVILGKTTMPDYGMLSSGLSSFHPLTRNPWDLSRGPGGSSSGAGAGAAAGYGPLHVGTDIGGSVRLPAGWCGIFTLKPSLGRIPIHPPYAGRVAGPMTRSVEDAALMMAVLSRPDPRDTMSLPAQAIAWEKLERPVEGLRIGLLLDAGWGLDVDPDVRIAVEAAARAFEDAGATVEPLEPFATRAMADGLDAFWRMRSWLDISALGADRRARVLPFIVEWARGAEQGPRHEHFVAELPIDVGELDDDVEDGTCREREERDGERLARPRLSDQRSNERRAAADDSEQDQEAPGRPLGGARQRRDDPEALGCIVEGKADHERQRQRHLAAACRLADREALGEVVEADPRRNHERQPGCGRQPDWARSLELGRRRSARAEHLPAALGADPAVVVDETQQPMPAPSAKSAASHVNSSHDPPPSTASSSASSTGTTPWANTS